MRAIEEYHLESHLRGTPVAVCRLDACSALSSGRVDASTWLLEVIAQHYVLENNVPERPAFCFIQNYASEVKVRRSCLGYHSQTTPIWVSLWDCAAMLRPIFICFKLFG